MEVANRIFDLLDKLGMEQKEFALLIGTTDKTVSTWKTGRTHSYRKYLREIAETLGTTPEYLLTGKDPDPQAVSGENAIKEQLQAAFWGGERDLTQEEKDAMWSDVEKFAAFLAEQKRRERGNGAKSS